MAVRSSMRPGTTARAKPSWIFSNEAPKALVANAVAKAFSWLKRPNKRMSNAPLTEPSVTK